MKISTVLAAALAAGLTTFAANAEEGLLLQASTGPAKPGTDALSTTSINKDMIWSRSRDDLTEDDAPAKRAITAEEILHAAKALRPQDRYSDIIERYASLYDVPVNLAHAVIKVESNYKVDSLGKAGEIGLMQIKPTTAKLMGYDGTKTGLFDPETNIKYGMKYLGKARQLGDGSTCGTILKYNAGHAAKRMNPTSQDYCDKVKHHIVEALSWLWAGQDVDNRATSEHG